jgi:predicted transposase YdaD
LAWHEKDKAGKWMIQHHGDSILRLGRVHDIVSWRPLPAEVVHPGRLPDGLLEARLAGQAQLDLFLLELHSYPAKDLAEQIVRKQMLVYLERKVLPEVLALILSRKPGGKLRAPAKIDLYSRLGFSQLQARWRVVELWKLSAEELLAAGDVGLIPWVPLTHYPGPPEVLLGQCRDRIDRQAQPQERVNLLAVTQVMASMLYNDQQLMTILGGSQIMIESPLLNEMLAKATVQDRQEVILEILADRFSAVPEEIAAAVRTIHDFAKLKGLVRAAYSCRTLKAFREHLKR